MRSNLGHSEATTIPTPIASNTIQGQLTGSSVPRRRHPHDAPYVCDCHAAAPPLDRSPLRALAPKQVPELAASIETLLAQATDVLGAGRLAPTRACGAAQTVPYNFRMIAT
jgi:hypothetical protein